MSNTVTTDSTPPLVSLDQITIASPCRMDWDLMDGDERVRFCGKCKKNVYNLSAMSDSESLDLIQNSGDEICGRIFKRSDGTVVTNMCPPEAKRGKRQFQFSIAGLVLLMTASAGLCAPAPWIGKKIQPLVDRFRNRNAPVVPVNRALMGEVAFAPTPMAMPAPKVIIGKVLSPQPDTQSTENDD